MFMLLFVNKPITFVLYVLGLCLVALISLQDETTFWFTLLWLAPAFSIFYLTAMTYYYLLRGDEKFEIKGVDIQFLKWPVRIYWFMSLIGLAMSFVVFAYVHSIFACAMFLTIYNAICAGALKLVVYARFFSLIIKKNPTLKNLKIEDFYTDIREVIMKKLIS